MFHKHKPGATTQVDKQTTRKVSAPIEIPRPKAVTKVDRPSTNKSLPTFVPHLSTNAFPGFSPPSLSPRTKSPAEEEDTNIIQSPLHDETSSLPVTDAKINLNFSLDPDEIKDAWKKRLDKSWWLVRDTTTKKANTESNTVVKEDIGITRKI